MNDYTKPIFHEWLYNGENLFTELLKIHTQKYKQPLYPSKSLFFFDTITKISRKKDDDGWEEKYNQEYIDEYLKKVISFIQWLDYFSMLHLSINSTNLIKQEEIDAAYDIHRHNESKRDEIKYAKIKLVHRLKEGIKSGELQTNSSGSIETKEKTPLSTIKEEEQLDDLLLQLKPGKSMISLITGSFFAPENHRTIDYQMVEALIFPIQDKQKVKKELKKKENEGDWIRICINHYIRKKMKTFIYYSHPELCFKTQKFKLVNSNYEVKPQPQNDSSTAYSAIGELLKNTDIFNGIEINYFDIMSNTFYEPAGRKLIYIEELFNEPPSGIKEDHAIVPISTFYMWLEKSEEQQKSIGN